MPLLLFLNERSCGTDCEPLRADRAMNQFARTAVAVSKVDRGGTVLVCEVPLKQLQIADGYPIGKWIGNPKNRDPWLRLRLMQSKAPFKTVFPDGEDPLDVEYRHDGVTVAGLGGAHLMDGLGISLPVHACWDAAMLPLECEQLVEAEDGSTDTRVGDVEVRHVSAERHLHDHLAWMRTSRDTAAHTGAQLWERRAELFPHLQFLPRVEADLRGLPQVWVGPVRKRLVELEEAVAEWDPQARPEGPRWRSWVTGEHQGRRRHCQFTDLDGQLEFFDTHSRFTPDEGRVHFRLVPEDKAVRVAYLGRKRGI
ncbi:hypothetical protein ACFYO0_20450 [Streptomyces sp. NPDC006365]|uniref:hypothetical protein n=1 Tax=Streptomyces sp. NPDC006365 TaxID=3364744 RepID=UPI0036901548